LIAAQNCYNLQDEAFHLANAVLSNGNEVNTMSPNLNKRSNGMIYAAMLAIFLTTGLSACRHISQEAVQGPTTVEMNGVFFESPEGAVMPRGLDELTSETIPDDVERIMVARYPRPPGSIPDRKPRVMEAFTYKEGGATKYIDIWYTENDTVKLIRYGYERSRGIE
jgi:hypothetical protein